MKAVAAWRSTYATCEAERVRQSTLPMSGRLRADDGIEGASSLEAAAAAIAGEQSADNFPPLPNLTVRVGSNRVDVARRINLERRPPLIRILQVPRSHAGQRRVAAVDMSAQSIDR